MMVAILKCRQCNKTQVLGPMGFDRVSITGANGWRFNPEGGWICPSCVSKKTPAVSDEGQ